jgi:hypothetical protein
MGFVEVQEPTNLYRISGSIFKNLYAILAPEIEVASCELSLCHPRNPHTHGIPNKILDFSISIISYLQIQFLSNPFPKNYESNCCPETEL